MGTSITPKVHQVMFTNLALWGPLVGLDILPDHLRCNGKGCRGQDRDSAAGEISRGNDDDSSEKNDDFTWVKQQQLGVNMHESTNKHWDFR